MVIVKSKTTKYIGNANDCIATEPLNVATNPIANGSRLSFLGCLIAFVVVGIPPILSEMITKTIVTFASLLRALPTSARIDVTAHKISKQFNSKYFSFPKKVPRKIIKGIKPDIKTGSCVQEKCVDILTMAAMNGDKLHRNQLI